jgi:hypothetical protein
MKNTFTGKDIDLKKAITGLSIGVIMVAVAVRMSESPKTTTATINPVVPAVQPAATTDKEICPNGKDQPDYCYTSRYIVKAPDGEVATMYRERKAAPGKDYKIYPIGVVPNGVTIRVKKIAGPKEIAVAQVAASTDAACNEDGCTGLIEARYLIRKD